MSPFADWTAVKTLSTMLRDLQPDFAQSFDTKPNLLLPLAARAMGHPAIVRTITGLGWVYSSRSPLALLARPVLRMLYRAAARVDRRHRVRNTTTIRSFSIATG